MPDPDVLAGTAGRPRNVLDDPFAVRGNRETTAGELILTYDPTPATWMWAWDNDVREDAPARRSIGFSCASTTTADAASASGRGPGLRLPGRDAARRGDLWEVQLPHRQPGSARRRA